MTMDIGMRQLRPKEENNNLETNYSHGETKSRSSKRSFDVAFLMSKSGSEQDDDCTSSSTKTNSPLGQMSNTADPRCDDDLEQTALEYETKIYIKKNIYAKDARSKVNSYQNRVKEDNVGSAFTKVGPPEDLHHLMGLSHQALPMGKPAFSGIGLPSDQFPFSLLHQAAGMSYGKNSFFPGLPVPQPLLNAFKPPYGSFLLAEGLYRAFNAKEGKLQSTSNISIAAASDSMMKMAQMEREKSNNKSHYRQAVNPDPFPRYRYSVTPDLAPRAPSQWNFPSAIGPAATLLPPSLTSMTLPAQNVCAKCNISFRMTSDLVYHMRSHHKREADPMKRKREEKLRCHVCHETFRERHHLTRHMTAHQDRAEEADDGVISQADLNSINGVKGHMGKHDVRMPNSINGFQFHCV